ncbi:MAG TPA: response regulator [Verrucomicrobiae bacterium]|nr:response regulator [Verrucomicrobiae bacterium]
MNGDVVYVVDDDSSVRRALSALLQTVGLDVETFPSAQAFLAQATPDRPACLVLDIRLRGSSGLDLQAALKEAGRDIPIIFITGHGDVPTTVRAMKGGAVDFLEKPFNDQQLLDCVDRALVRTRELRARQGERAKIQQRLDTLSSRERQVLMLVVTGMLNKQIAGELDIAEKTVKVHRGQVMRKMSAGSVVELLRMVEALGLLPARR